MRAAFLLGLVIAAAALAFLLWSGGGGEGPMIGENGGMAAATPSPAAGGSAPGVEPPPAAARAVATRANAGAASPGDLALEPTACVLILDHDSGAPIVGASIRRMKDGATIGFSDARGLAPLPLPEREQLVTVADGYLLRMTPTRLGSTEAEPQQVELVRDRWSVARRFEFRSAADGAIVDEAFVRIAGLGEPSTADLAGPGTEDAVLARAWREHGMLSGQDVCADVAVCRGSAAQVLQLANGEQVRFIRPGTYEVETAAAGGLVQSQQFVIPRTGNAPHETVRIDLVAGSFLVGTVVGLGSEPVAGAELTRQGGDPLGLQCITGDDGAFAFGPLPAKTVTLLVRHRDHEPIAFGPIASTVRDAHIQLRPLPQTTLRGRVRRRPGLEPVAGANVAWTVAQNPPMVARTDADGTFRIVATGEIAGRLAISAPGLLAYEELVEPGMPFADYDLLPGTTTERLAGGMTAVLAGIVVDASGRPLAGVAVRWTPDRPTPAAGLPGRRSLRGATLELAMSTATGEDGAFALETDQFGTGTLSLVDREGGGTAAVAIAGATKDGYRLQR
ncbi:MAG: carboxypeptidase regulatory-like domain-containing protein [Planctomycetes bacterium]|nr:carboxypeptidase regulatory-like domain-containing protein [Planctomycetota bacterium]